jgi:hypothetical protein
MNPDPLPSDDEIGRAVEDVLDEADPGLGGIVVGEAVDSVLDQAGGVPRMRIDDGAVVDPEDEVETPKWAEKLVRVLDDGLKIPGTDFGIGIDGLVGFILPGVGDMITGSGSLALIYLAFTEKVPTVALARMVLNIAVDTIGGSFPIIGDVFDVFWKSNRKNLDIIEKYRGDPDAKPTALDYLLVLISILLVLTSVLLPLVVIWLLAGAGIVAVDQLLGQ